MLDTGVCHELKIMRIVRQGAYLNKDGGNPADDVLLPVRQVPDGAAAGDAIKVFVYMDSDDRVISTTREPLLTVGSCSMLTVAQTTRIGAFLDWGLEKDLFLPFDEQRGKVRTGDRIFVGLKRDEKMRLFATMYVSGILSDDSPYKEGDRVSGTVYGINERIGAFTAVSGRYHGLVPSKEIIRGLKYGDVVDARITSVRKDGKLMLSLRNKAYGEIDGDASRILFELKKNKGFLPYGDHSSPNLIKKRFSMSKGAFKRAIGRLYKKGEIDILGNGIRLKNK